MLNYYQRIKQQYNNLRGDSTDLFNEIIRISNEIGMDEALAYLEQCVTKKRLSWLKANRSEIQNEDDPLKMDTDGFMRNIWVYRCRKMARL